MARTVGRIRYAGARKERETWYTGGIQLTTVRARLRCGDEGIQCFVSIDSSWLVSVRWINFKLDMNNAHRYTQEPRRSLSSIYVPNFMNVTHINCCRCGVSRYNRPSRPRVSRRNCVCCCSPLVVSRRRSFHRVVCEARTGFPDHGQPKPRRHDQDGIRNQPLQSSGEGPS